MVGRTNTGGGGSGATLTIIGVAGATVTASKNGKTYTRTFNNSGTAVFKGLSTGTWTVMMSGDGQTATRTVEITADYSLTIAYFSATITITYPANSICVVTDSSGATIASNTNTGTAAKTWTATVNAKGTYTVTATATDGSGKTKSMTVSITADGQVETVTLTYETVLFDGADNTAVTGGWTKKNIYTGYGNVEVGSTINIYGNTPYGGASAAYQILYITKNKINLSNLNTLIARTTLTKARSALFVTNSQEIVGWWPETLISTDCPAYTMVTASTATTNVTVDLGSVSGSYYVGILCDGTGQIVTPRVWLE